MDNKLRAAIAARPTLTLLRDSTEETKIQFDSLPKVTSFVKEFDVPENFDGRIAWKGLLTPVRNQGRCGSCWAFASTSTLADRFNIQSVGQMKVELSVSKLILCDFMGEEWDVEHPELEPNLTTQLNSKALGIGACRGNTLYDAWRYLYTLGTPSEECIPYDKSIQDDIQIESISKFSQNDRLPFCTMVSGPIGDMCIDVKVNKWTGDEYGTPARLYRCIHFYSIAGTPKDNGSEFYIRKNIYEWGPVSTGMIVYPNFYTFDPLNEIYEWDGQGEPVGGHAIEIVGWGEQNAKKYWIIKNSWGPEWGRQGFFYMTRGNNMCQIEDNIVAGIPDYFFPIDIDFGTFPWAEPEKVAKQRLEVESKYTITGGGIDPTTGYSRRAMTSKPWLNFQRPVDLKKLPDWNSFIAGIDANINTRKKYLRKISGDIQPQQTYSNTPFYIALILIPSLILLIILCIKRKVN